MIIASLVCCVSKEPGLPSASNAATSCLKISMAGEFIRGILLCNCTMAWAPTYTTKEVIKGRL